jgi:short-subunit dehydrogenase
MNRTDRKSSYSLITGSSQGLGRGLAEECGRLGMNLFLIALPGTGLPEAAAELSSRYRVQVEHLEMDLTAPASAAKLLRFIRQRGLAVDMLINNAGLSLHGPFLETSLEEHESLIELNIKALVRLTYLLLPELMRHPRTYILNVASLGAFYAMQYKTVYAPSKSFVLNFTLALREELRGSSVRVCALCPGGVLTNAEVRKLIAAQGLIGRLSCHHPHEVAAYAIRCLLRNKAVIIPGAFNKLVRILGSLAPRPLVQMVIRMRFGAVA